MARGGRAAVLWVVAGLIVVAGIAVVVVGLLTPVTFGWFAYQPLAAATLFVVSGCPQPTGPRANARLDTRRLDR